MTRRLLPVVGLAGLLVAASAAALVPIQPQPVRLSGCTLSQPQNVTASSGNGVVTLRWDPVPCARGYGVHRSDVRAGAPIYASLTDTAFTDRLVRVGATLSYFVTPFEPTVEIREGPLSAVVSVTVQ